MTSTMRWHGRRRRRMSARGVLIKPWLFREINEGYRESEARSRVAIYRLTSRSRESIGACGHGLDASAQFPAAHRLLHDTCRGAKTVVPSIQVRESERQFATPLDALLARTDEAAHEYLADCLTFEREIDPGAAPSPESAKEAEFVEAEG